MLLKKLLCIHMAEFKVTIEAVWEKEDGSFEDIGDGRMLEKQDDVNESSEDENME
jgi:hypothetical protein